MFKKEWGKLWNHGGSMFATFWIVIALYALGIYLVRAFLQLDAEFSRPLAGDVIPAHVTQEISWGTRAFSVIAGSVAIYFAAHRMKGWASFFSAMTFVAALLLLIHAYGIASKIMQGQYDNDAAIGQVATVDKDSIQAEIDDLIDERDALPGLTDSAVATFQRSIDSITNDGLDNDDEAQAFADKQVEAITNRDARLKEIRTDLATKRKELRGTASTEIEDKADSDSFNPLFIFFARLSTWEWDPAKTPSVVHSFGWGMLFFTLFFGFGEILMMACFTGGYAVLKLRSVQQLEEGKDPVRVAAGKKGAETKSRRKRQTLKIQEQADSYLPAWKKALQYASNTKWTAKGIADTAFPHVAIDHVIEVLRKANKKGDFRPDLEKEINLVKRLTDPPKPAEDKRYAVDIIDRAPNGSAQIDGEDDDDDAEPSRI